MTISSERKHAAFCWHHLLRTTAEHMGRANSHHRYWCPESGHLSIGAKKIFNDEDNSTTCHHLLLLAEPC